MNRTSTQRSTTRSIARFSRPVLVVALIALASGCTSTRFGGDQFAGQPSQPQPLPAAPSGSVQTGALPPAASGPGNIQPGITQPTVSPPDPTRTAALEQVAPTPPAAPVTPSQPAASSGLPVTQNALVGNWSTSVGGASCSTFFGLTNLGSGLLGGTRGCSGKMSEFRTWQVAGNNAVLRDNGGGTVATLSRTGDKTFSGTTTSGEPVTLTR